MGRPKRLFTGLLVAALAGAGWAYHRAQARQAATLGRITALESRLISSNEQRAKIARSALYGIATRANKMDNQAKDMVVFQQAKEINSRTETLLDTLHHLRQSWLVADRRELRQFPIQLYQYVAFIRNFVPNAPLLNHTLSNNEAISGLGKFDMSPRPKPAALALLTKLETQVRQMESEALMQQAQKVNSWGGFDRIGAFAIPASETVAPGAVYQARLMLLLGTSTSQARFSANGREVPTDPATGQAAVRFKIPAARPGQPDTVRAEWGGRVQIPWAAGDTVLEATVPYFIVKPRQR
jgi:hypothetical protein